MLQAQRPSPSIISLGARTSKERLIGRRKIAQLFSPISDMPIASGRGDRGTVD